VVDPEELPEPEQPARKNTADKKDTQKRFFIKALSVAI